MERHHELTECHPELVSGSQSKCPMKRFRTKFGMTVLAGVDFDGRETSIERALFKRANGQQSKRRGTFATNYLFPIPVNSALQGCYARRYATNYLLTTSTIQLRKVRVKGIKRFFGHPTALALNGTPLRSRPLLVQAQNDRVCKKAAFTLAEVLITLGIIGIVAAITIPMLMTKYEKIRNVNQLKKTYSELSQAFKAASEENDLYTIGDNWQDRTAIVKALEPYIKILNVYTDNSNGINAMC